MLNPGVRVTAEELYKILLALRQSRTVLAGLAQSKRALGFLHTSGPLDQVALESVEAALEVFAPSKLSK